MIQRLKHLRRKKHPTLNNILIHRERILHNRNLLNAIQPGTTIIPVLKANAYGHGISQMCQILKESSASLLAVDSYPEYLQAKNMIDLPILIMGELAHETYQHLNPDKAQIAICSLSTLEFCKNLKKPFKIHIFLNTGMNREWVQISDIDACCELLKTAPHLQLEGIMSHLANADIDDPLFIEHQVLLFKHFYQKICEYGFQPKLKHIANTAGLAKINDPFFNAARSGIGLYGYNPLTPSDRSFSIFQNLQPALQITSQVIGVQHIHAYESVSYGNLRTATQRTKIITVPFGYYEWLSRSCSSTLRFRRNNHEIQQVGRICMNLCTIDAGDLPIQVGDTIEIISHDPTQPNSLQQLSTHQQTIPYETLAKLSVTTRRSIV